MKIMAGASKGSLSLIQDYYDSDCSDDDVPGPKVSTKREFKEEMVNSASKKQKTQGSNQRLPLPSGIKSLFQSVNFHVDNPALHEGRVRSFSHERGNWATFVSIPHKPSPVLESLMDVIVELLTPDYTFSKINDLHISLTRTVILRHHWIDPFISSVQKALQFYPRFNIGFASPNVYTNEEKTRTFVGLTVDIGYDRLLNIVSKMDKCLADFKLPSFYKDPSFHMSLAWCLGDKKEEIKEKMSYIELVYEQFLKAHPSEWYKEVSQIECKCGNKDFCFPLQPN